MKIIIINENFGYPIQPNDIIISDQFGETADKFREVFRDYKTGVAAKWILQLCQEKDGWHAFTEDEIIAFCNKEGYNSFSFHGLVIYPEDIFHNAGQKFATGNGMIVKEEIFYRITEEFIQRCFDASDL